MDDDAFFAQVKDPSIEERKSKKSTSRVSIKE